MVAVEMLMAPATALVATVATVALHRAVEPRRTGAVVAGTAAALCLCPASRP